jgi:uncharacterized protein involved in exopolysaccharide biosynthesis
MSNHQPTDAADDEINLKELFLTIWAYKLLIALVSSAFLVGAGLYALNADKLYTAESAFTLPGEGGSNGILVAWRGAWRAGRASWGAFGRWRRRGDCRAAHLT